MKGVVPRGCLVVLLSLCVSICLAVELRGDERIVLTGRVTDVEKSPVPGARVRLLAPKPTAGMLLYQTCGSVESRTRRDGQFEISFAETDPRFVQSRYGHALMLVSAPGFALQVQKFRFSRCLVDVPFNVVLEPAEPISIHVRSPAGQPLAGVEVRPAMVVDRYLPFEEVEHLSAKANDEGNVRLDSLGAGHLTQVYLSGDGLGRQCVKVTLGKSGLVAKAIETRSLTGRISATENSLYDAPALDAIQLEFYSTVDKTTSAFSWCRCQADKDGRFEGAPIGTGNVAFRSVLPSDFPYVFEQAEQYSNPAFADGAIELNLVPATLVEGQVVDAISGEGVPNMFVSCFSQGSRSVSTDPAGRFRFWAGPGRVSYYPSHPTGRYTLSDDFYIRAENLPEQGRLELKPVQVRRMSQVLGRVVDLEGKPLAGVPIECVTKPGRFSEAIELMSDRSGQFRFYGVSDGTSVALSARIRDLATERPLSILLQPDSKPVLKLKTVPVAHYSGLVVGMSGDPVADAVVTVRRAVVEEEEAMGGEDRHAVPLFPQTIVSTDAAGRFQTPMTTDFDQDTSINVRAIGYQPFNTGWRNRTPAGNKSQSIDLGQLQLMLEPRTVQVHVVVRDADSGKPLRDARVAFLGARSGLVKKHLRGNREATLAVKDTPQLAAASAAGYAPTFLALDSVGTSMTFHMQREVKTQLQPAEFSKQELIAAASRLLARVPEPGPADTYYRMQLYYESAGFVRPSAVIDRIQAMKLAGVDLNILRYVGSSLVRMSSDDMRRVLSIVELPQVRSFLLTTLAGRAAEASEREDLLAEALISVRQLRGREQLSGYSHLACSMLEAGMLDMAQEVLAEAWDGHRELQQILKDDTRLERGAGQQGVARYFAPPLALVDRQRAMKLIELTAYADEIDDLQSEALAFLAGQDVPGWWKAVEEYGLERLSARGLERYSEKVAFTNFSNGKRLASLLPPSARKARFLLHLAERATTERSDRVEMARTALATLRVPSDESWPHPGQIAASALRLVVPWDRQLAAQFAFEGIWLCEREYLILPFHLTSELAQGLAEYDATLARVLVEPCFTDWSWLFPERDHATFYRRIPPLIAAASIDPEWGVAMAEDLLDTELSEQPSRKLAVVRGIISQLTELHDRE